MASAYLSPLTHAQPLPIQYLGAVTPSTLIEELHTSGLHDLLKLSI
jgi:hypothetical protein